MGDTWRCVCSEVSVCISGLEEFKQYDVVPCSISIGDQLHVSEVESCFQPYGPPARLSASHNDSEHTYMHPTNHSKLKPTITLELAINLTAEELENTYTIPMLLLSTSLPLMFAYSFFFQGQPVLLENWILFILHILLTHYLYVCVCMWVCVDALVLIRAVDQTVCC